jgi:methylated-DNA-[protein]-cysteine S-methyltransferase
VQVTRPERLAGQVSPRVLRAPARLQGAAWELDEYFLRRTVLPHLTEIGYGETASYPAPAGNPRAVAPSGRRAAPTSLPVVPCHRVVRSDGTVGQYAGGADVKRALLALEAAAGCSGCGGTGWSGRSGP